MATPTRRDVTECAWRDAEGPAQVHSVISLGSSWFAQVCSVLLHLFMYLLKWNSFSRSVSCLVKLVQAAVLVDQFARCLQKV